MRFYFLIVVFCHLFLISCSSSSDTDTDFKYKTIYLNDSLLKHQDLSLNEDIRFYWQTWPLEANGSFNASILEKASYKKVPFSVWTSYGYPAQGFGTYRFSINRKDPSEALVLNFDRVYCAAEVWVNNSKVATLGSISKSAEQEIADGRPLRVTLPQEKQLDVMVLVSSHNHRIGGGFPVTNTLEGSDTIKQRISKKRIIEGAIAFLILVFGCYQLLLYLGLTKYKYFLFLGLFCVLGATRQFFVGEAIVYDFFPNIPFSVVQKIRYITYYGALGAIFLYHTALFPNIISKKLEHVNTLFVLIGMVLVVVLPTFYATYTAPIFQWYGLVVVLFAGYLLYKSIALKMPYAWHLFMIMFVCVLFFVNDLLYAMLLIDSTFLMNYGLLFYVFFQVVLNGKIQRESEQQLIVLEKEQLKMKEKIYAKQIEVSTLVAEGLQQIKKKEKILDSLKSLDKAQHNAGLKSVLADLQSDKLADNKSKLTKERVNELNSEFIHQLKTKHSNLTKTDIEIASFIRLGLNRNDIAEIRGTTIFAVKNAKARLKKKLDLPKEASLDDYLFRIYNDSAT